MGLNSIVKGIVSQMEKVDTVNTNALEKWRKRAVSIAKDLSQSDDKSQQRAFETEISDLAQSFIGAASNEADSITNRLEPDLQSKRAEILIRGDEILDSFQPPSPGRAQVMKTATQEDAAQLKGYLKGLNGVSDGLLREIDLHTKTGEIQHYSLDKLHGQQAMSKQQRAHVQLFQRLHWLNADSIPEPSIVVRISDMTEDANTGHYRESLSAVPVPRIPEERHDLHVPVISFEDTFSDLVEMILESDDSATLPDFWCKRNDSSKNQVTDSGLWWECQTADKRIAEVIMEEKRTKTPRLGKPRRVVKNDPKEQKFEIRSVLENGEYLVALVGEDGRERGVPVGIPRSERQPTSSHFQEKVFPNNKVGAILLLENGADASPLVFDNRRFHHKTNPLYVELIAGYGLEGKGKGREG